MDNIKINRIWAMPNKNTFQIKPIKELLQEEMNPGFWIDPFSGDSDLATTTNDLNPDVQADYHLTAQAFLEKFEDGKVDSVLYDPPYSVTQVRQCYKGFGYNITSKITRADWWTKHKMEIARIVKSRGKVISFGWNSGIHNDTICVVEQKMPDLFNK